MSERIRFYQESDHAIVFGIPGVAFQQKGRYFRRDGSLIEGNPEREREIGELRAIMTDPAGTVDARDLARLRMAQLGVTMDDLVAAVEAEAVRPPETRAEIGQTRAEIAPEVPQSRGWSPDDMRRPENKALKAEMDIYGEPWTTPAAAREFLGKAREIMADTEA